MRRPKGDIVGKFPTLVLLRCYSALVFAGESIQLGLNAPVSAQNSRDVTSKKDKIMPLFGHHPLSHLTCYSAVDVDSPSHSKQIPRSLRHSLRRRICIIRSLYILNKSFFVCLRSRNRSRGAPPADPRLLVHIIKAHHASCTEFTALNWESHCLEKIMGAPRYKRLQHGHANSSASIPCFCWTSFL